ncbi:MAG: acyltransferase [Planctomycetota bacterium]|jgi:acetyltransferase-like isoleucine patch superfamily enzyme
MDRQVHPSAIIEDGVSIGEGTAIWDHAHLRKGARIGKSCIIGEKSYLAYDVVIGDLVKVNAQVYICAGVTIEKGCLIAAQVAFTNETNPRATDPDLTKLLGSAPGPKTRQTLVKRGASIGAQSCIGPGLTLGEYCMIGMGSVVTRDVPAHGLVMGNPARLRGLVARNGERVWTAEIPGQLPPDGTRIECPGDGCLLIEAGQVRHQS